MNLAERHIIKSSNKFYRELDDLSLKSKNLYNRANYLIRQRFTDPSIDRADSYLNSSKIYHLMKISDEYKALPAKVSNSALRKLDKDWLSFFRAIKDWKKFPNKYKGRPRLPGYKNIKTGRALVIYDKQAISKKFLDKEGLIKLSKTNIIFKSFVNYRDLRQVRIVPRYGHYVIEVVHCVETAAKVVSSGIASIDLGLNNLCSVVTNDYHNPKLIINGKPLKSINSYYNKKRAKFQKELPKGTFTSKKLNQLTNKRNRKIDNYLHKSSKYLIDFCLTLNTSKIVIGYNKGWKNSINLGKRTNQNFVSIPFYKFVSMIDYKAKLSGIEVIFQEESYTSKCSALDNEPIKKPKDNIDYVGKRIKRGLFQASSKLDNIAINADINGALNILRKAISNFVISTKEEIQGFAVSPMLVTV